MYVLYIANKNYSSWSLRPWILMRGLNIEFAEHLLPFGAESSWAAYRSIAPSGKVPALVDGGTTVWDSLSITEYLAERHRGVWPAAAGARAWARSAAAEMHSGFGELRNACSMTCGVRLRLHAVSPALRDDLQRLTALWTEGLGRFGGAYLAGPEFCAVDAFFAPVAFRVQTYGLTLEPVAAAYVTRLLELPAMREWYAAALSENFRDEPHEAQMLESGTVLADHRS